MPIDLKGLPVVSFESRRATEMAELISNCGGQAIIAPTTRVAPLKDNPHVFHLAESLLAGQIDVLILLTGVGTSMLSQIMSSRYPRALITEALHKVVTVARGPKPATALAQLAIEPTVHVPDPSTWQELLTQLDQRDIVSGKRVAIQQSGQPNTALIEALKQRGAEVTSVPVYQWQLPDDLTALRGAIAKILAGDVAFALFTNSTQVHHLFKATDSMGDCHRLRNAFKSVAIGSVGPSVTRAVREHGMTVDLEPDSTQMVHLVREMARRGHDLLQKKRTAMQNRVNTNTWKRIDMVWPAACDGKALTILDSVFMKACRRQLTPYTPIWLMRQAGRFQRAYRAVKAKVSFLELCKTPDLAAELTLGSVDQFGVDAAIIFSDLLPVTELLGMQLQYVKGAGPVIENPLRSPLDIRRLPKANLDQLNFVFEALKITRRALRPDIALIGFAGGPFTIASYMIEGGKSSTYVNTKSLMYANASAWHLLMERLTDLLVEYLNAQQSAGADALQLFDSWVGVLGPDEYRNYVYPHVKRLAAELDGPAPLIHFATGNATLLALMKQAGGHVIGLDWRVDLAEAWAALGDDVAVMGNLDPAVLYAPSHEIRRHVKAILDKANGRLGHIFNLGHGILPTTPPTHVAELVDAVHELSAQPIPRT